MAAATLITAIAIGECYRLVAAEPSYPHWGKGRSTCFAPFSSQPSDHFRVGAANLMSEDIKVSLIGDRPAQEG